ncbi:MAG TPA: DUF5681 domain-containing protein [Methylocella sp.]
MKDSRRPSSTGGGYTVGYGRPPRHTRFLPGRSGNPKGRPKGSNNLSTLFADELARTVTLTEDGKRKKISKRQALVKHVINRALSNDVKAVALVFDEIRRCEELAPVQQVNMNITAEEFEAIARKVVSEI